MILSPTLMTELLDRMKRLGLSQQEKAISLLEWGNTPTLILCVNDRNPQKKILAVPEFRLLDLFEAWHS